MNFFQFHIGDWNSGTKFLTPLEKGIYLELLLLYYETERPLVRSYFERITRGYTDDEKRAFNFVIGEFFIECEDGLHHKRCDKEIAAYKDKSEKARKSVQARWGRASKKKGEAESAETDDANVIRPYNDRNSDALLTNNQEPITNIYTTLPNGSVSAEGSAAAERSEPVEISPLSPVQKVASRCPHEKLIDLYHQEMPNNPIVRSWNSAKRRASSQARWKLVVQEKKFESEAEGLEWFRSFFAYCNRSAFLRGEGAPDRNGRTFVPDLEWILTAGNFDKIIDRRYHD